MEQRSDQPRKEKHPNRYSYEPDRIAAPLQSDAAVPDVWYRSLFVELNRSRSVPKAVRASKRMARMVVPDPFAFRSQSPTGPRRLRNQTAESYSVSVEIHGADDPEGSGQGAVRID